MDLADDSEREAWRRYLGEVFAGRKVIIGFGVLAAYTDQVALLHTLGAATPLVVVGSRGTGPVPPEGDAIVATFDPVEHTSMTEEVRSHNVLAHNLPAKVRAAVEEYDPAGDAVWCFDPFVVNEPLLGRRVYGGRPAPWIALEDKILVEEIWTAVDAPRAPSIVVEVDLDALREAARELDQGQGTVWSGDARGGINGGGDFVRWVETEQEQKAAFAFFAPRCDRVRVMPFLEGVPCSIHGIVLPDGVAAFRPMELAMLRIRDEKRFVFGGMGTTWDPPASDRDQMRDLVRRTGGYLADRAGYRGFFGIDGVLTEEGFRPTEVNPRMSGGASNLIRALDMHALWLLQMNLVAGRDPRVTTAELEDWALPGLDANRIGRPVAITMRATVEDSVEVPARWDGSRLTPADDGDLAVQVGPTGSGTFAKIDSPDVLQRGERLAPLNVALMRFLDEHFGTDFGPVEAAPDVRLT